MSVGTNNDNWASERVRGAAQVAPQPTNTIDHRLHHPRLTRDPHPQREYRPTTISQQARVVLDRTTAALRHSPSTLVHRSVDRHRHRPWRPGALGPQQTWSHRRHASVRDHANLRPADRGSSEFPEQDPDGEHEAEHRRELDAVVPGVGLADVSLQGELDIGDLRSHE